MEHLTERGERERSGEMIRDEQRVRKKKSIQTMIRFACTCTVLNNNPRIERSTQSRPLFVHMHAKMFRSSKRLVEGGTRVLFLVEEGRKIRRAHVGQREKHSN